MARNRKSRQRQAQGGPSQGGQAPGSGPASPPASERLSPRQQAVARREAQRQARLRSAQGERRQVWLFAWIGALAVVVIVVALVVVNLRGGGSGPGQEISNFGATHIAEGTSISQTNFNQYNSDPPTSGPHWPSPAPRGFYSTLVPDERLVHNLEHGYVVIHHNCNPALPECDRLMEDLERVFNPNQKVIVNYRPQTQSRIALTAWTRLDTMEEFDEVRIAEFIEAYQGKIGPERNAP